MLIVKKIMYDTLKAHRILFIFYFGLIASGNKFSQMVINIRLIFIRRRRRQNNYNDVQHITLTM